jgi:hypothetical protein
MKFDLNEIAALLHIHKEAMGHPQLKPLADQAMVQLHAFAAETAKDLTEQKKAEAEKAQAEAAAKAQFEADHEEVVDEGDPEPKASASGGSGGPVRRL